MLVVIGKEIYSADEMPVMLVLTKADKQNIANMADDAFCYCAYPQGRDEKEIRAWMTKMRNLWHPSSTLPERST